MPPTKPTWRSQVPNIGQKWFKTLRNTKTFVFIVNNRRNQQTNGLHWHLYPFLIIQTSKFLQIFLAQWSQRTATKNLCSASQMHSQSTLWSLRLPARMLKQWLTPFMQIGSQNSEFRPKFTSMVERNSSISYQPSFFNFSTSAIQKLHRHILSAIHK